MFRWFLQAFFLISIFCSGCAFIPRDVNIDIIESSIAYPRESLSSQYYINFEPLKDLRPDKNKLGVGRNKLMMVTTFVTVTGNVKSLFEKIVKQNFAAAGLGPGPSPFTVKTELIQAYTDLPGPNDVYVQIKLSLTIVNSETNIPLFHKILKGYEAVPVAQLSNISHEQAFIGASNQISEQVFDVASRIRQTIENNGQRSIQAKPTPPVRQPTPQSGTGSGFFVSKMGHVITNAHVVQNCKKITIGDNANKQVPAEIINTDRSNDLALLKLSTLEMASAESKSLIQKLSIVVVPLASKGLLRSNDVKLGEKVLVAGYPFGDRFSNTIKVTSGIVSATRGAGDDSGQFQLDAAVQPGNSGGPIYDRSGNIVGIVVARLNKQMFKSENVNFGIKASSVRQFLNSSGFPSKKSEQTEEKSTEQLAEIAKNQALMVMCLQ